MPPAFILSQDQTLHLILTQTLLRFDFVNWLLSIKCCFKNRRVNFEYWIVCNQSFQRAICLWSELYHSQGLFILSPAEPGVNNFCEIFWFISQAVFPPISKDDWREALGLGDLDSTLIYYNTGPNPGQAFLWNYSINFTSQFWELHLNPFQAKRIFSLETKIFCVSKQPTLYILFWTGSQIFSSIII